MNKGYSHTHMNFVLYVYINNFGAAGSQISKYIHAQLRPQQTAAATCVMTTNRLDEVKLTLVLILVVNKHARQRVEVVNNQCWATIIHLLL